jgi:hypothetical protein
MSWRYAVSREKFEDEEFFAIREVYFDIPGSDGPSWTVEAVSPQGSTLDELIVVLRNMLADAETRDILDLTQKPVLILGDRPTPRRMEPDWS